MVDGRARRHSRRPPGRRADRRRLPDPAGRLDELVRAGLRPPREEPRARRRGRPPLVGEPQEQGEPKPRLAEVQRPSSPAPAPPNLSVRLTDLSVHRTGLSRRSGDLCALSAPRSPLPMRDESASARWQGRHDPRELRGGMSPVPAKFVSRTRGLGHPRVVPGRRIRTFARTFRTYRLLSEGRSPARAWASDRARTRCGIRTLIGPLPGAIDPCEYRSPGVV